MEENKKKFDKRFLTLVAAFCWMMNAIVLFALISGERSYLGVIWMLFISWSNGRVALRLMNEL